MNEHHSQPRTPSSMLRVLNSTAGNGPESQTTGNEFALLRELIDRIEAMSHGTSGTETDPAKEQPPSTAISQEPSIIHHPEVEPCWSRPTDQNDPESDSSVEVDEAAFDSDSGKLVFAFDLCDDDVTWSEPELFESDIEEIVNELDGNLQAFVWPDSELTDPSAGESAPVQYQETSSEFERGGEAEPSDTDTDAHLHLPDEDHAGAAAEHVSPEPAPDEEFERDVESRPPGEHYPDPSDEARAAIEQLDRRVPTQAHSPSINADGAINRWWVHFSGRLSLERLAEVRKRLQHSPFVIDARFDEIGDGLIILRLVTSDGVTGPQLEWILRQLIDAVGLDSNCALLSRQ